MRGMGFTLRTASAVHLNISGAFFRTVNDMLAAIRSHRAAMAAERSSSSNNNSSDNVHRNAHDGAGAKVILILEVVILI